MFEMSLQKRYNKSKPSLKLQAKEQVYKRNDGFHLEQWMEHVYKP
jgi:hypothetical protein